MAKKEKYLRVRGPTKRYELGDNRYLYKSKEYVFAESQVLGLLKIVALAMLIFCTIAVFSNAEPKSLSSFLAMLRDCPMVPFETAYEVNIDLPTWISFLEPIYGALTTFINIIVYCMTGIANIASFIFHILMWVFAG